MDEEAQHSPFIRAAYVSALSQINALRTEVAQMTQERDVWAKSSTTDGLRADRSEARLAALTAALEVTEREMRDWLGSDEGMDLVIDFIEVWADRLAALRTPEAK